MFTHMCHMVSNTILLSINMRNGIVPITQKQVFATMDEARERVTRLSLSINKETIVKESHSTLILRIPLFHVRSKPMKTPYFSFKDFTIPQICNKALNPSTRRVPYDASSTNSNKPHFVTKPL